MAHLLPTFERYFLSEKFSDVDVEVLEELEQSGQKRKRGLTIPGHSMVLVGFSAYCSVKVCVCSKDLHVVLRFVSCFLSTCDVRRHGSCQQSMLLE